MKFSKELYSKVALMKAAYNYTDRAYVHLDVDEEYYYVTLILKDNEKIEEEEFMNEMLAQAIRHEVYKQTKNIRELLLARAVASSIVVDDEVIVNETEEFDENDILKDWFINHE